MAGFEVLEMGIRYCGVVRMTRAVQLGFGPGVEGLGWTGTPGGRIGWVEL